MPLGVGKRLRRSTCGVGDHRHRFLEGVYQSDASKDYLRLTGSCDVNTSMTPHKLVVHVEILIFKVMISACKVCGLCDAISGVEAPTAVHRSDDILTRVLPYAININFSRHQPCTVGQHPRP